MNRRHLVAAAAAAVALLAGGPSLAQSGFPDKPVTVVVPFPPGGGADVLARLISAAMARDLGQPIVVENRPGAGGNVGAQAVARASPDGYTLFYAVGSILTANPHLYAKPPFDPFKDFAAIGETVTGGMVLVARPQMPFDSLDGFLAYAKANPGKLSYASYGNGSFPQLNMEWLKAKTGTDLIHVPYKGAAPAMNDLLGNQVDVMFDLSSTAVPQIRAGKLKALAVNTPHRLSVLPDVPTLGEKFAGFDGSGWQGLFAPGGTPEPIIAKLSASLQKALADPTVRQRIGEYSLEPGAGKPAPLAVKLREEHARWREVMRNANIKVD